MPKIPDVTERATLVDAWIAAGMNGNCPCFISNAYAGGIKQTERLRDPAAPRYRATAEQLAAIKAELDKRSGK